MANLCLLTGLVSSELLSLPSVLVTDAFSISTDVRLIPSEVVFQALSSITPIHTVYFYIYVEGQNRLKVEEAIGLASLSRIFKQKQDVL